MTNTIFEDPFRNRKEIYEWINSFSLNEESIEVISKLLKSVERDMTSGEYFSAILDSNSVKSNPKKFLELIKPNNPNLNWLKGLLMAKYALTDIDALKSQSKLTRLSYAIGMANTNELSAEIADLFTSLWDLYDDELIPTLINHMLRLTSKHDFSNLLIKTPKKWLWSLFDNLSFRDDPIERYTHLFIDALNYDSLTADQMWYCIYFKVNDDNLISKLCIETFHKYRTFDLKYFDWCIKEKVNKNSALVAKIIDASEYLDYFNKRCMWSILTEGNPIETVNQSVKLTRLKKWDEPERVTVGTYFDEIKQKLFRQGNKDTCLKLYKILSELVRGKEFFKTKNIKEDVLETYSKNQILELIHEITTQLMTRKTNFDEKKILETMRLYGSLNKLLEQVVNDYLTKKEYNPIIDVLSMSRGDDVHSASWAKNVLSTLDYYFSKIESIPNMRCPKKGDVTSGKVSSLLDDIDSFLSEAFIFERIHKAGILKICEPDISGRNPEFIVEIDGKDIILEVKNYFTSEDLRLSGLGSGMEEKFRRDFKEAFFQTVPLEDPELPVVLVLDRSRSFIDESIVHNAMHGSLSIGFSIKNKDEKPIVFRKNDSLAHKKGLARFIQAVVLFNPVVEGEHINLKGILIEHLFRDKLIDISQLNVLKEILFSKTP